MRESDFTDIENLGVADLPNGKRIRLRRLRIRKKLCMDVRLFRLDAAGEFPLPCGFAVEIKNWPAVREFLRLCAQTDPSSALDASAPGDLGGRSAEGG